MSFYKEISEYYDRIFPFTEKKGSFLKSLTSGKTGSLLDIGCATGELVFFAESIGLCSTGLDIDHNLLNLAVTKKNEMGSDAEFVLSDMKNMDQLIKNRRFDIITCMGNTLAHLGSPVEIGRFFRSVYGLLKRGGVFAGQVVNYKRMDTGKVIPFRDIENGDFRFSRESIVSIEKKRVVFSGELTTKKNNKKYLNRIVLYPVTRGDIETGLQESGFKSIRFHGDFDGKIYECDSEALIFSAGK